MPADPKPLKGYQKKYLRAQAHSLKPVLLIGHRGLTPMVARALEDALDQHELIKIKFIESKTKADKQPVLEMIQTTSKADCVGMVGHTAIFFRQNSNPKKRKIHLPKRPDDSKPAEAEEA